EVRPLLDILIGGLDPELDQIVLRPVPDPLAGFHEVDADRGRGGRRFQRQIHFDLDPDSRPAGSCDPSSERHSSSAVSASAPSSASSPAASASEVASRAFSISAARRAAPQRASGSLPVSFLYSVRSASTAETPSGA